ncbi:hypothetical protein Mnod_4084 [Methylobacterium nodulans ORS 2060]|uniref:Uncharacterized protein n=1 Tax=Methylobacterium nodulans (strain LMG 21967 / CNCM I-2342 / ORS 2060) TaxID=460265 RepID=B8ITP7_METNO|nr:hypothetical protein Mnod_4084 [Methylobacterium nodulans ORS 2060]
MSGCIGGIGLGRILLIGRTGLVGRMLRGDR